MLHANFLVFDNYESLDLFGVVEVFGQLADQYELKYYSMHGGLITSSQQAQIMTQPVAELTQDDLLIVPGGQGTRTLVDNKAWIDMLGQLSRQATNVLTICTGSALLGKTGLLNGKQATTNKRAFDWVVSTNQLVDWQAKARWSVADKYYTSSGISAGIDMALGYVSDTYGRATAEKIAFDIEYIWNDHPDNDVFVPQN